MLMECGKMGLSIPNKIYFCILPFSMVGMPSLLFRNLWPYFRDKDISQLEISFRWKNGSNRFSLQ